MYIKWICCGVGHKSKENFSLAQAQWTEIQQSKGFIGQLGGWDLKDENTACIMSFWENQTYLKLFMKHAHYKIILGSRQSEYYDTIFVEHFIPLMDMKGAVSSIINVLDKAKLVRIGDCVVKKDNIQHFERAHKNTGLRGMNDHIGYLSDKCARGVKNNLRYLVYSCWDSYENHLNYARNAISELSDHSNVKDDMHGITERNILLVDSWKVLSRNRSYP